MKDINNDLQGTENPNSMKNHIRESKKLKKAKLSTVSNTVR